MLKDPFIRVYENAIPDELCDSLLDAHRQEQLQRTTWAGRVGSGYVPSMKISEDSQLLAGHPAWLRIQSLMRQMRERYLSEVSLGLAHNGYWWEKEPFIQRYPKGRGYFKEHVDLNVKYYHRHVVFIGYLNDVTEGGETFFPYQGIQVKPVKGRVVMFPPYWMYPHGGAVPLSDDKTVVTAIHSLVEEPVDV